VASLTDDQGRNNQGHDRQGKDVGTHDGFAHAFDRGIAAAKLSAPPNGPGGGKLGLRSGACAGTMEGFGDKQQIGAGAAFGQVTA
jgi:hypothetical protein